MIRTSVIVVSWNGEAHLADCLNAVLAQLGPDDEIIVVDNGSVDGSVELVRERYVQVHLIENGRNLGYAGGCNVGLGAARGTYLMLVSQDVTVEEGWLEAMLMALASPDVGIVGCRLLYPDGTIQHAGGCLSYPLAHMNHDGHRGRDEGQWDETREVDCVVDAALGLKRELLDRIGLLDEGFFPAFYETADLCYRARAAGYRAIYAPATVGVHRQTRTIEREGIEYNRWMGRGRLRFILKHYTVKQFRDDFVPAERSWLSSLPDLDMRQGLRMAYLDTLLGLRDMPRTGVLSEEGSEEAVGEALIGLRQALAVFPERAAMTTPTPDLLVEPPWRARRRSRLSGIPIVGPALARLCHLLRSVWRLQENLAVVQEILVCLDREMTEGRRLQAEATCASRAEIDLLKGRVQALEEPQPGLEGEEREPRVDR